MVPQNFTETFPLNDIRKKSAHSSYKIYAHNNRWGICIYGTEWGVAKN